MQTESFMCEMQSQHTGEGLHFTNLKFVGFSPSEEQVVAARRIFWRMKMALPTQAQLDIEISPRDSGYCAWAQVCERAAGVTERKSWEAQGFAIEHALQTILDQCLSYTKMKRSQRRLEVFL